MFEYIALAVSSFIIGELLQKSKLRVMLVFDNLKTAKRNLRDLSGKVVKKGSSGLIFGFGKKVFNTHHSKFGWMLAGIGILSANVALLSLSAGFIIHHLVREKSIF
ncbi:hypothetical protein A3K63_01505 [Candidatus Micrarchaeota archaeon RBG_16_49_10]|nr:MAG: hypothetical protein A3K63_01505 [Candidatus Micrarchaeota archaeon RBG_16_49_10]